MSIDTVGPVDAVVDVTQEGADDENAQARVQLYSGNDELLAEVNVDSDASMGQLIARVQALDSSTEDTMRAWQERVRLRLTGSENDMVWISKDNYTKIMHTDIVKQLICKTQYPIVFHGSVGKERRANTNAAGHRVRRK